MIEDLARRTAHTLDHSVDPLAAVLAMCEQAREALVSAATVLEAKDVLAAISTLEHAVKVRNMNHEAVVAASTLRIRAERRVGELIAEQARRGERRPRGVSHISGDDMRPTLAEQGLTLNESSTYQRLAAAPAEDFEAAVEVVAQHATDTRTAVTRERVFRELDPHAARTPSDFWKDGDRFKSACDRVTELADAAAAAIQWRHYPDPNAQLAGFSAALLSFQRAMTAIDRNYQLLEKLTKLVLEHIEHIEHLDAGGKQ